MSYQILQGDCRKRLKDIPSGTVRCSVTSPPYYGLRDYGVDGQIGLEQTPEEFVQQMVQVFREVRRVLTDDGTLWVNMGDSYAGSMKGIGSQPDPKWSGARNDEMKHSTNWSQIGLKPKDLIGMPWRIAFALQADGWYLRSDIIWHKPNPMPESVKDRPTKAHEYIFLFSKSERYYYNHEAIKEPCTQDEWANGFRGGSYTEGKTFDNSEGGKRTTRGNFKVPTGWDTEQGSHGTIHRKGRSRANSFARSVNESPPPGQPSQHRADREDIEYSGMRNKRSVWTVATQGFAEAHFATFPPKLIEPCILAGSESGDTILDPFNGAATSGLVALENNRKYIGIELNQDYIDISNRRLSVIQPVLNF